MTHHRNDRTIAPSPDQFDAVLFGGFRQRTRRHDGLVSTTIPEVTQPQTVPYFVQHHGDLIELRECDKIRGVNTHKAGTIGEGSRPRHALRVDVLGGLMELRRNVHGEPRRPEKKGDTNHRFQHATDRRSLPTVLLQQIPIETITAPDQSVTRVTQGGRA